MYCKDRPIYYTQLHNPQFLRDWREYCGSLTDRLHAITGAHHLDLLEQGWKRTTWWDRHCLQINKDQVFQREIVMSSNGKAYWYARTIIPEAAYELNHTFFKRLENESIRHLIFDEPKVERIGMITYPVDHQCIEFQWVKKYIKTIDGPLIARLSEFSFQKMKSFYLCEVLLPELENL